MWLVNFSLRQPVIILVFWTLIVFFGLQSLFHLDVTFMPPSKIVDISVVTAFPGADKDRVLEDVTKPLEKELLMIKDLENITSETRNGKSEIKVHFTMGVAREKATSAVNTAITQAKIQFPSGVSDPVVKTWTPMLNPLKTVAMTSALPPPEFYDFADNVIKPEFENIEGVSKVELVGQRQRQLTVSLDLERMRERQVTASQVVSRLKNLGENVFVGKDTTYSFSGEFTSANDLGSVIVRYLSNNQGVALKDISDIREEITEPDVYAYLNGKPSIIIEVYILEGADILAIQDAIDKVTEKEEDRFRKGSEKVAFYKLTNREINLGPALHDFTRNTWIAIFVAVFLIGLVFKDFRSIFISGTSIPASLCGSFLVMYIFGYSLNTYTIPALVVSVGLIIDDMIVIRENIFRHLEEGMTPYDATIKGMKEMGGPVFGTTCMLFAVCLPLIVLRGSETGQYLENFGVAMILAMAFSLLEAFTLGPLLCAYCLKPHRKESEHAKVQNKLDRTYANALAWVHTHGKMVLLAGVAITILGFITPFFIPSEEMPAAPTGSMEMRMRTLQGIPLKDVQAKAYAISQGILQQYPDIAQIGVRVGGNNEIIFYVEMVEKEKRKVTAKKLKIDLEKLGKELKEKQEIISYFVQADVTIPRSGYIPGFDLRFNSFNSQLLREYSQKIFEELKNYDGLLNLAISTRSDAKETAVAFDFNKMNRLGVISPPVVQEVDILLNGDEPVNYHPPHKTDALKSEVKVKTELTSANTEELFLYGYVPNVNNTLVPFRKITGQVVKDYSQQTNRENGEEYIEITADINKEDPSARPLAFAEELFLKKYPLPEGVSASWVGKAKKLKDMGKLQAQLGYLAFFFIYIVLILIYQSITIPIIILISLPFSVAGSFFALYLTNNSVNICSIIGIVLAIGIAAKNGIILIDYTNQLIAQGMSPAEAIDTSCRTRLRPILMTSFGVFLTTIPVIIGWDDYSKIQVGLGIAVIGGLVTAMILSLFLLPIIFKYTHRFHVKVHNFIARSFNPIPKKK